MERREGRLRLRDRATPAGRGPRPRSAPSRVGATGAVRTSCCCTAAPPTRTGSTRSPPRSPTAVTSSHSINAATGRARGLGPPPTRPRTSRPTSSASWIASAGGRRCWSDTGWAVTTRSPAPPGVRSEPGAGDDLNSRPAIPAERLAWMKERGEHPRRGHATIEAAVAAFRLVPPDTSASPALLAHLARESVTWRDGTVGARFDPPLGRRRRNRSTPGRSYPHGRRRRS